MGGQGGGHQAEHVRNGGEVVEAVAVRAVDPVGFVEVGLQLIERIGMVVLTGDVLEPFGDCLPLGPTVRGSLGHVGPELLVGPLGPGDADDGEPVVEHPPVGQPRERRKYLSSGEVA